MLSIVLLDQSQVIDEDVLPVVVLKNISTYLISKNGELEEYRPSTTIITSGVER